MFVFVQGCAEAVASSDVEADDLIPVSERRGQRSQRSGVGETLMRPMLVVEVLEFAQRRQQVSLVADQGAVHQREDGACLALKVAQERLAVEILGSGLAR